MPIVKLCNELENLKHVNPKPIDGNSVLEWFRTPNVHNAIAPDDFLGVISKCLIEFRFLFVKDCLKVRSLDLVLHFPMK